MLGLAGCGDSFHAGPMSYVESERLTTELKDPKLQDAVRQGLKDLFGPDPTYVYVPKGSGLFYDGGVRLASHIDVKGDGTKKVPIHRQKIVDGAPQFDSQGLPVKGERQEGGYGLYRKHCLHCHGVSGAGDGPTALFLFPRPRDYRPGKFKFTSTPNGVKPTRDDLRKTIKYGLHGTSMPAFEALMSTDELEQVLDYMIFLSIRGETELALIDEATFSGSLPADSVKDFSKAVFDKWKAAESQVLTPPTPRPPSTSESVQRGRELFLARNKTGAKVECTSCHGPQAVGDGPSFVSTDLYNRIVFGGKVTKQFKLVPIEFTIIQTLNDLEAKDEKVSWSSLLEAVKKAGGITGEEKADELITKTGYVPSAWGPASTFPEILENVLTDLEDKTLVTRSLGFGGSTYHAEIDTKIAKLWNDSLDEWNNPLRPNNLNRGVYKGGRRPLDIYWRIAKGINGAKMPSHYPALEPEKIWDLVNFVLALPFEPDLLEGATLPSSVPAATPAVATR
jgi:mono/diheme cytochrome c family protein